MPIYDLTIEISPATNVFPGDPVFECKTLSSVSAGSTYTLKQYQFGNHTGTHIDFPAHVIQGGKTSADYPLEKLIGTGFIIEIPHAGHVMKEDVLKSGIQPGDIVFFKTQNSRNQLHEKPYTPDFAAITPEAAKTLVDLGARIVGIDYLSIDAVADDNLSSHHVFLSKEILVVENLDLSAIPPGRYEITIAPLKVKEADGLPARVFATSMLSQLASTSSATDNTISVGNEL